eukprot:jgi/Botrbrau1/2930/Bobra.0026s0006.2
MAGCTGCITLVILLQIAAAIAIIVIIPLHLQQIQWDPTRFQGLKFWDGFVESNVCLLGTGFRNAHLCTYAIVAAGVSVGASLLISLMQCISCNFCSFGPFVDVIFQGAGTAWWIVASIIVTKYARQANSLQYPQQDWRDTVMYLSWALAGLFAVGLCVSIGRSITVSGMLLSLSSLSEFSRRCKLLWRHHMACHVMSVLCHFKSQA